MQTKRKLTEGIRIASLLLEYFIMFAIIMLFSFPAMNNDSFGLFRITHEAYKPETLTDPLIYLSLVGFSLLFCKDCINGQSITKRILKLQVVDNKTGAVATPMQCFTRNITLLITPVECIVALVRPDRRIGDKIAGTKLVIYEPDTNNKSVRSVKKYILPLVLAYALFMVLAFGLSRISFNNAQTNFIATTYNETKSKALEKLLTDRFDEYYAVSVRCYDSIKNSNLKYVSVICRFKESFFDKPGQTEEVRKETVDQIYILFTKESINGQLQYVYQSGGSMTTWNEHIGMQIIKEDK